MLLGKSDCFKDQKISFPDGSVGNGEVHNTGPTRRTAPYCVTVKSVSCRGVLAQTHRHRHRLTPSYTQEQSQPQRASVGWAGATSGQRRIVASLGRSWTRDSVSIHLLVVTQKQRAARTASVTNNTCLHTGSVVVTGPRGQRYGNGKDVDESSHDGLYTVHL